MRAKVGVSWTTFVKAARASTHLSITGSVRDSLTGRCVQCARILAELIGGQYVRGYYIGPITVTRPMLFPDADGRMPHSWVEKEGFILDPTWWAFTDAKMQVYEFQANDARYLHRGVKEVQ